jgi:acyl-CoA hydrolase/RimJ/RimL family protein N-acetyltransferase
MSNTVDQKRTSVKEALRRIRRGGRIFVGSGCGEPQALTRGLVEHAALFADNPIIQILTQGDATYTQPQYADFFRLNAFFIGPNVRTAIQQGRADYTPIFLSEVPALFASGHLPLEAALIQVSPPDAQGFCSLGISVDVVKAATQNARLVIAQVNPQMPRTLGDTFIHLDQIHAIIEQEEALLEWKPTLPNDIARQIGGHLSKLVSDGATLQIGIGTIPDALLAALEDKNDLGVHSDMLSDGIMRLSLRGNINGRRKTLHPNMAVASFAMGTRELYDWIRDNPHAQFFPSDYTNDPGVICQNERMVAINSAIAIDLTGQVSADNIGNQFFSGLGGQVDFLRGAARSKGGRPIIALPSTAGNAEGQLVSRILPQLEAGSGVGASRGDVHYVATEYGVAYLHGKSIAERARALIEIAHPDFRAGLLEQARVAGLIPRAAGRSTPPATYPAQYEHSQTFTTPEGQRTEVLFRPIRAADERKLQEFFYSHSDETIWGRYGYMARSMNRERALQLVELDYQNRFALVGTVGDPGHEEIIAVGRYERDDVTNLAEVAFVVHEKFRKMGLATHLLRELERIGREHKLAGFTAQVLAGNLAMLRAFDKALGYATEVRASGGEIELIYRFNVVQSTASPQNSTASPHLRPVPGQDVLPAVREVIIADQSVS